MDHSGSQPRFGAADADDNPEDVLPRKGEIKRVLTADTEPLSNADVQVISGTADSQVPFCLPALDHLYPHPGDVLAWAYGEGRIHADPLMQRLEAIGALLNVELMIVPPFPPSEIMAALDKLAAAPLPPIEAPTGALEDMDTEINRVLSADTTTADAPLPNTDMQVVRGTATSQAPFPLPALDHPHPGDVLAWAYREGHRIHADPLMQRLEVIGALLDVELDGDVPPSSPSP